MHKRARIDANQTSIVRALRMIPGVSCQSLATIGNGCPDLLAGFDGYNSQGIPGKFNQLYEIKVGKGKLNDCEKAWHEAWHGQVKVVHSVNEILEDMGLA